MMLKADLKKRWTMIRLKKSNSSRKINFKSLNVLL